MKLNAKEIHVYLILLASVLALITVCLGATTRFLVLPMMDPEGM